MQFHAPADLGNGFFLDDHACNSIPARDTASRDESLKRSHILSSDEIAFFIRNTTDEAYGSHDTEGKFC